MKCPKCSKENITINIVPVGEKRGLSVGGWFWNNFVAGHNSIGSARPKSRIVTEKVALCQNCGHSWEVK